MFLSKKEFVKRVSLVGNNNYTQIFSYFVWLLRKTRLPLLKYNGFFMGALQMSMLRTLSKWQKELLTIKKQFLLNPDEKEKKFLEEKMLIYTEWIRVFQTIADGIAWRNLKFNRPVIRLFSENNSPGYLSQDYVKVLCSFLNKVPNFVIANDLTRCLRVSDLTHILPDGKVLLYEIKKSGKLVKDVKYILNDMRKHKRPFSKQEIKQWIVQSSIIDKKIRVPIFENGRVSEELKAEIVESNFPVSTHFSAIKKLIREADKSGYAQKEVEPGYYVKVTAYDKMLKGPNADGYFKHIEQDIENKPDWLKNPKSKIITLSNYESFIQEEGQYTRNLIPYSVIPFSAKNCIRLMMGGLSLRIYYNLDVLKEKLEKNGWVVTEVNTTKEESKERNKLYKKEYREAGNFYKYDLDESLYILTKKDEAGTYKTSLPLTLVLTMMSSMYKSDFLVEGSSSGFLRAQKSKPKGHNITINFLGEKKVLI